MNLFRYPDRPPRQRYRADKRIRRGRVMEVHVSPLLEPLGGVREGDVSEGADGERVVDALLGGFMG